jgi:flagellar hook-length control protein FliK
MNAAPPVFQAPSPSEVVQPEAPASAAAPAGTRAGGQDFAAALSDAGGVKPARKGAASKPQTPVTSGSSLPPPGNQPPVAVQPPAPAKTEPLAAAVADAAAIAKPAAGGTQGAVPGGVQGAVPGATILTSASLDPAPPTLPTPLATAAAAASSTAAMDIDDGTPPAADGPIGSGRPASPAPGIRALPTPRSPSAASAPQLRAGSAEPPSNDVTVKQGTAASMDDSTLSNGPAASGTDAAAQTAMAAAIAQATSEPAPDSSSADDAATPAIAGAQAAAGSIDPAVAASAAAMARVAAASITAAVTAATATAVALTDSADVSAADKRSRESPDATLSGASNDGSAGAAQLLTSNTSSDSAPTPTFKVAAGVDTAQFGQGVADRVSLMMDGNLTSAKLQVNPPALGPIEVRIALQGGHAQVWLSSHSAVTRDALEASSPKLREMLGSQGFSQVSVDISQRSFQERLPQSQAYQIAPGGSAPVSAQAPPSMSRSASGLLDAYA